ncbi:MAG TPA: hypothetical protein VFT31_14850 [Kribbella sp.]|nr:hypothetical protein [Kribbella sp.]
MSRRQALWNAARAAEEWPGHLFGATAAGPPPTLPGMTGMETTMADLWATGISPDDHPVRHIRTALDARASGEPTSSPPPGQAAGSWPGEW